MEIKKILPQTPGFSNRLKIPGTIFAMTLFMKDYD